MEQEQARQLGPGAGNLSTGAARHPVPDPPEHEDGDGEEGIGRVAALGPWLLLFPLVFCALAVAWMLDRREPPARAPTLPSHAGESVPGWAGSLELEAGLILAQLAPLHSSERRQAFERRTLALRFALDEGEPWKLVLRFVARDLEGGWEVDLERAAIEGTKGRRLAPLDFAGLAPGEPADPLAVLLAPPHEALAPGCALHLVLWGPDPGPEPVLRGLYLRGPRTALLTIPLEAQHVQPGPTDGYLAHSSALPPDPPRAPRQLPRVDAEREAREDRPPGDVPPAGRGDEIEETSETWPEDER